MKKNREDDRPLRGADYIVTFLCLIGAFLCLYFFWLDFNHTLTRQHEDPVGIISWKYHAAQRRFANRVLWDRLKKNTPIYNGDYIRTAELSEATITFTGGNIVDLDENTLIEIFVENGKPRLDLFRGDLAVNNTAGTGIILRAGDKTVYVDEGTVLNSRITADGNLNLSLSEGSATVEADGETRQLAEGDALSLDSGGLVFDTAQTVMLSPKPTARLIHSGEKKLPVEFAWKGVNYAADDRTRIDIATDRGFTRILHSLNGAAQDRKPAELAPGVYYWRAYPVSMAETAPAAAGDAISSGRLTIASVPAPKLLSPEQGFNYQYRNRPPALKFQWTASPEAASYLLEAADNPGLENPALRESVQGGTDGVIFFNFTGLEKGRWYWRVTPVLGGEYEGSLDPSAPASFTITRSGNLAAPALLTPRPDAVIGSQATYFSWQNEAEAESYTLLISPEADLRNPVITRQTAANYYSYGAEDLPLGQYYWGVYQTGLDGKTSGTSPSRPFTIQQWEPVLRPTFPQDTYTTTAAALRDTRFTWKTNLSTPLRFQVSVTPDFARLEVDEAVAGSFTGLSLGEGQWYWRVAAETGSLQTAARSLRVRQGLAAPERLAPAGPITVQADTATAFTWQDVDGADTYTLNLYIGDRSTGTPLRNIPFIRGSQVEIPLDQDGAYTWTVQAFVNARAGSTRLSSPLASAAFTVNTSAAPPPGVPPAALLPEPGNRRPLNGYTLGVAQLRTVRTIAFSWNAVPAANRYIVTLYRETAGGRQLVRRWEPSRQNSLVLDDLSILGNSGFIWQVEAMRVGADDMIEQRGTPGENRFTVNLPPLPRDTLKNPGKVYGQ
ncbi:hypothetical protein FACS1894130_03480 [Spirochaetia bacterium]|nr:hypothetical protein FACS1894130_03480 [Spirochaetia bacterium]